MIRIEKKPTFKDAKDLQSLAGMLAPNPEPSATITLMAISMAVRGGIE